MLAKSFMEVVTMVVITEQEPLYRLGIPNIFKTTSVSIGCPHYAAP